MSKLKTPAGDDHPEAAQRHLADAKALQGSQRPDGAAYLSGYVVECALKSLWLLEAGVPTGKEMPWKRKGHELSYLSTETAALASIAGAKTARYFKRAISTVSSSAIASWKPEMRYQAASMTLGDSGAWLQLAADVYQETIAQMQLDGVL